MMLSGAALRKTGDSWEFASEFALEDFVWANLEALMGLIPLKRQYVALGEICDILAVNQERQLHILELKNSEDRYIVQQLTRYFDNLIFTAALPEQIDYSKPVKLIAIAPTFHRHNLIDRKYSKLEISFLQLQVSERDNQFGLELAEIERDKTYQIAIPYTKVELVKHEDLPEPPKLLLDWLGSCTGDEQEGFLKMREQVLLFDKRIQENLDSKKAIQYGKGKPCVELCWERGTQKPVLFLRLPLPSGKEKQPLGRMRIWTDGKIVFYIGHVPEGLGKMKPWSEWQKLSESKQPRNLNMSFGSRAHIPTDIQNYLYLFRYDSSLSSLENLVNLALEKWRERL
ncbi:endonuclease NucS [Oscillatoria laete-virens NRMC-F 0139]|nr:endonuclease NucS [Oscillatoria laete-virens]MDL5055393.1 endonuclease NucS [Oscillatoria laete-virens NRMC-F 0139]